MIENLYSMRFGNKACSSDSPQYDKLHNQWLILADQMVQQLSSEQEEVFNIIMELRDQCQEKMQSEMYIAGFKDGAMLMHDLYRPTAKSL